MPHPKKGEQIVEIGFEELAVIGTLLAVVLLIIAAAAVVLWNPDTYSSTKDNSVSEEYRVQVRDKMIENGSDPTEAEAFTKTLTDLENEWRNSK